MKETLLPELSARFRVHAFYCFCLLVSHQWHVYRNWSL